MGSRRRSRRTVIWPTPCADLLKAQANLTHTLDVQDHVKTSSQPLVVMQVVVWELVPQSVNRSGRQPCPAAAKQAGSKAENAPAQCAGLRRSFRRHGDCASRIR